MIINTESKKMNNIYAKIDRKEVKKMNLEIYLKSLKIKFEIPNEDKNKVNAVQSIPEKVIKKAIDSKERNVIEFIDDLIENIKIDSNYNVKEFLIEEDKLQPLI